ncbi:MAG: NERD domain-containing protein [Gammaproteobacteria bacterium]|nr:NERD domain-containing protein [Gammaproteobacteria bacterium]
MAYIVPSDISRLALSGAHLPELETLRTLKSTLSDDYTVFHGVHWTREYHGWTHFGEIDFVVLNRSGDVLFIEQKNGVLSEEGGRLAKHYDQGEGAKDPVGQVHRSIDKVREKFYWRHGKTRSLDVDYLVYLPDHLVRDLNAAGLDASRIVDAGDGDSLPARIEAILRPGHDARDGWRETVHEFFCQTFQVVPDIQAHRDSQERTFVRQIGPVASILTSLEMTPFRLRFTGTSGSGKSLVARHFYARASDEGKRVLLTCFNRPLAMRLRDRVSSKGYVDTFHGFCVEFLKRRGQAPDFDRAGGDPEFWRRIPDLVTAERIPEDWLFDALVVDEGQDFEQEWLEILCLFLRDGADILWLEDPEQNLQDKPRVETGGFVGFHCPVNYRSPESIARFLRNTMNIEFESGNDLPGLGAGVHRFGEPGEQPRIVARIAADLVRRGFTLDDIVVLSCRGARNSVFSDIARVGAMRLRRFTGDYDAEGNQILTDGKLTFESIYRFKGQEAPAVILVDVDPREDRRGREEQLLYCGMTRATVRLDLVVREGNPTNRRFLQA